MSGSHGFGRVAVASRLVKFVAGRSGAWGVAASSVGILCATSAVGANSVGVGSAALAGAGASVGVLCAHGGAKDNRRADRGAIFAQGGQRRVGGISSKLESRTLRR